MKCTVLLIKIYPVVLAFAAPCRSLSTMKRLRVPILLAACLGSTLNTASADGLLTVHANEASAQIEAREQGQITLPSLDLSLIAAFACPADAEAESVTISVADTHKRYGPEDLADTTALEVSVNVPAGQIAPIASAEFCHEGGPVDESELLVPGVATAHVSLRCRSESGSWIDFASVALPLRLHCLSEENQDSSTDR